MTDYEHSTIQGGGEHPDHWDHPKISDAFSPLDVTDAVNQAQKYWQMSSVWEQGVETFIRSIQNSISQAWSGVAAEASKTAIQDYVDKQARPLTPGLAELYTRVRDAADSIVNTKKALPDPVVVTWTSWAWPPHRWDLQRDQSSKTEEARAAMAEHYVTPFAELDTKIPVLKVPVGPTHSVDIPASTFDGSGGSSGGTGSPGGTSGGTANSGGSGGSGQATPSDRAADQAATDPSGADGSSPSTDTTPSNANSGNSSGTSNAGSSDPAKTVPSSASTTDSTGTGASRTGGGAGSGRSGSGGSESGRSGAGSGSGSASGGPGRSVQGLAGTGGGTGTGSSTAAAATSSGRGTSGMAPGAAGRGNGKDDESEHKIPDYLITQENTDELLGEIPPTIAGGVIGGTPE